MKIWKMWQVNTTTEKATVADLQKEAFSSVCGECTSYFRSTVDTFEKMTSTDLL